MNQIASIIPTEKTPAAFKTALEKLNTTRDEIRANTAQRQSERARMLRDLGISAQEIAEYDCGTRELAVDLERLDVLQVELERQLRQAQIDEKTDIINNQVKIANETIEAFKAGLPAYRKLAADIAAFLKSEAAAMTAIRNVHQIRAQHRVSDHHPIEQLPHIVDSIGRTFSLAELVRLPDLPHGMIAGEMPRPPIVEPMRILPG